jgi:hypothetical protein
MNYRTLTVAVALIAIRLVIPFAFAAPKAYDAVFYKGKAAGLRIIFEFDHGHVEASNVKITESASGKTTKFYLTGRDGEMGTGKIRFAPVKGAKKEVLLEMDPFGDPLSTVKGSYTVAGKLFRSLLQKGRSTERLNCRFQFHERRQLFIRVHNETLSVVAMRVCNPNRSRFGIN